jgi:hypothetical protein
MIAILAQKYWKELAGIALILVIFLFGWYKGYSYEKQRFDAFVLQTKVNAKIQQDKNALLVKQQQKVSENLTKEYANAIKKLNTYYATKRMSITKTPVSDVPNVSSSSITINGEAESNLSSTIRDCSLDVVQLLYLQKWIKDSQLIQGE